MSSNKKIEGVGLVCYAVLNPDGEPYFHTGDAGFTVYLKVEEAEKRLDKAWGRPGKVTELRIMPENDLIV